LPDLEIEPDQFEGWAAAMDNWLPGAKLAAVVGEKEGRQPAKLMQL